MQRTILLGMLLFVLTMWAWAQPPIRYVDMRFSNGGTVTPVSDADPLPVNATIVGGGASSPTTIQNGFVDLVTPGTAVALGAATTIVRVTVQAKSGNVGTIYIGGSNVDNTNGPELLPGKAATIEIDDLSSVFIDGTDGGDGVVYWYES